MSASIDTGHISKISNQIQLIQMFLKPEKQNKTKNNIDLRLIETISDLFLNICDKSNLQDTNLNLNIQKFFISTIVPSISIKDYLIRLVQLTRMEESSLIFIVIYIDRFCSFNHIKLTHNNIHKLILTSMFIAIKFNEDKHYSLEIYAKIGGVSPQELKSMEFYFLVFIQFNLNVDTNLYQEYHNYLESFQEDEEYSGENESDKNGDD